MHKNIYSHFNRQILFSLFFLLVLPLAIIGHYLYSETINDMKKISTERAVHINDAAESLLIKKGNDLLHITKTNSYWEDNRIAVELQDIAWIQENVDVAVDVLENVDFVATIDFSGHVISQAGDVKEFTGQIAYPEILEHFGLKQNFYGLIKTSKGLSIFAASKVTDDLGEKPPAGILVFGRILNDSDMLDMKESLQANVSLLTDSGFYLNTDPSAGKDTLQRYIKQALVEPDLESIQFIDKPDVAVSKVVTPLIDFTGRPIGVFSTEYTFKTSKQVSGNLLNSMSLAGAIIVILILFVTYFMQRQQYRLYMMSITDELTGLYNRRGLLEAKLPFRNVEGKAKEGFLLYLDLDRFKFINDTLGHDYGDLMLKHVAAKLNESMRKGNTLYRIGGDEFVAVSPTGGLKEAEHAAKSILRALSSPFQVDDKELYSTCSIGISLFPDHGTTVENLMRNADIALSAAKLQRNRYEVYTPEMNEHSSEKVELESDLRKAIGREELYLHYQPRWDLQSGRLTGVEALLRWNHPVHGAIPPDKFIPIAEETGFIVTLGEWVLHTACKQMKQWQDAGYPSFRMAVNVSASQFLTGEFAHSVSQIVKASGIQPERLELELTESMLMLHQASTVQILKSLNDLGIHLYIDDFGKGYSSLSYLVNFPISGLKIDRSFVRDINIDPNDKAVTTAIIRLGHSLGLKVIAEGVETEDQLIFLQEQLCNEAQGYLFSRPISAKSLESLLQGATMAETRLEHIEDL